MDFDIFEKLLAILFSLLIFGQAYLVKRVVGTYIHPAAIFALAWFLYTIIPLVALFSVPINPLSILFIHMCVLGFTISALPFNWKQCYQANLLQIINRYDNYNSFFINCLLCVASIFSIVFATVSLKSQGFDVSFNLFEMLKSSGKFAALGGHNQLVSNDWNRFAMFFTYSSAILGGLVYRYKKNYVKKIITLMLAFSPAIYFAITQSSKLVLFHSIGFYIGAMLLMKIKSNNLRIFEEVKLIKISFVALFLISIISFSILSRDRNYIGVDGLGDVVGTVFPVLINYALGELYAFSDFFSYHLGMSSETAEYANDYYNFGYYTFKGVFDTFGGTKVWPSMYYTEAYSYKDIVATNIFTIFRGLIYDFGTIGTVFVMFVVGWISHGLFYVLLVARNSPISNSFFIVLIVFIQISYLLSIFTARYALLIFVVFCFVFFLNDKLNKSDLRLGKSKVNYV
jgi:oligosaccharide repeat unit polymerase